MTFRFIILPTIIHIAPRAGDLGLPELLCKAAIPSEQSFRIEHFAGIWPPGHVCPACLSRFLTIWSTE